MKMKTITVILAAELTLLGCGKEPPPPLLPEAEWVEIKMVHCEERGGDPDCTTVVEFMGDRTRAMRFEVWGEVGDRYMAQRTDFWRQR